MVKVEIIPDVLDVLNEDTKNYLEDVIKIHENINNKIILYSVLNIDLSCDTFKVLFAISVDGDIKIRQNYMISKVGNKLSRDNATIEVINIAFKRFLLEWQKYLFQSNDSYMRVLS